MANIDRLIDEVDLTYEEIITRDWFLLDFPTFVSLNIMQSYLTNSREISKEEIKESKSFVKDFIKEFGDNAQARKNVENTVRDVLAGIWIGYKMNLDRSLVLGVDGIVAMGSRRLEVEILKLRDSSAEIQTF